MEKLQVNEFPHLYRDPENRAVINSNKEEYEIYLKTREQKMKEKERVEKIENDVLDLKNDIGEIKSLLRSLVNGS